MEGAWKASQAHSGVVIDDCVFSKGLVLPMHCCAVAVAVLLAAAVLDVVVVVVVVVVVADSTGWCITQLASPE